MQSVALKRPTEASEIQKQTAVDENQMNLKYIFTDAIYSL
jgi:hypothetical protein